MKLSVEIVDHIFSFLVSEHSHLTLIACSKDPVLFPIVERHLYYNITVLFTYPDRIRSSDHIYKLVSENPHIVYYVRALRIRVLLHPFPEDEDPHIKMALDRFAKTLLMFPVLECIVLDTSNKRLFCWPVVFQAALKDRLSLPTVKTLHVVGNQDFSCPLIDNRQNIENLLLSGSFTNAHTSVCNSTLPQLKSVTLLSLMDLSSLLPHMRKLQSLKCARFSAPKLSELLGACSQTLNRLDINLDFSMHSYSTQFAAYLAQYEPWSALSPIPLNLQQVTIRFGGTCGEPLLGYRVISPILDIDIDISRTYSNLAKINFSPLAALGPAALSIPHIDLYIHTDFLPSHITLAELLISLEDCEDVMRSINEGIVLVIHSEKRLINKIGEELASESYCWM